MSDPRNTVVEYPCLYSQLRPGDIAFDIGAYRGRNTIELAAYSAEIYAFEPAPKAFKVLQTETKGLSNVHTYPFGLGDKNAVLLLGDALRDGSSFLSTREPIVTTKMIDIVDFCNDEHITDIALMCINIEGWEFRLVPHIIKTGLIMAVQSMTIYWHYLIEDSGARHQAIERGLSKTHFKTRCPIHYAMDVYVRRDQLPRKDLESE